MLTLRILNDGFGDNESASYEYVVFINSREISRGTIGGHDRNDGWEELVRMIATDSEERRANAVSDTIFNIVKEWVDEVTEEQDDDDEESEFNGAGVA